MTNKEIKKYADEMAKLKVKCSCGHSVIVPAFVDRKLCRYCHRYVYKDPQTEFRYKMQLNLLKANRKI